MIYEDNRFFHLQTEETSYVIEILPSGHPAHVYYGRKIKNANFENTISIGGKSSARGTSTSYDNVNPGFSLNHVPLDYSSSGKGDYRNPAICLADKEGNRTFDFTFSRCSIKEEKTGLSGLPSSYGEDGEKVESLELELHDAQADLTLVLTYSVFPEKDILTRNARLINKSSSAISIDKIASMSMDFDNFDYDLISLDGAWIRERHHNRRSLNFGITELSAKKGSSSAEHNPFMILCDHETTEYNGDAYGFALMYSGNHSCSVEVSNHNYSRVQLGINDFDFQWQLDPDDEFQTPEAVLAFSPSGLNGMSRLFHNFIKHNVVRGEWKFKERPILINNWEATYFDFNEKKLLTLAKEANSLGVELFVLDDGWFGKRNDDKSSLGDWFVNKKKLPGGVKGLADKINKLGMDFGIWVEPEMISIDSDLYRKHPDWMVKTPNREASPGRYQFLLDLSNSEVCDYIFDVLSDLFKSANISYVKWDMNRGFSDLYSSALPGNRQKEFSHRYILGLYNILERLNMEFPSILFESCASGGSRFDMAMFYYMPQIWTSDDTDAQERVHIQYGSSMFAPPSVMGAHVSAVPNHQVLRKTPIESRFNTSAFGLLGYELDLTKLTNFEKKVVKKQIAFYKKNRILFQFGDFYRLKDPSINSISLWMVVSHDKQEAIVGYYQKTASPNPGPERYKLAGLDENSTYELKNRTQYLDIRQFGDLINMISPISLKEDGLIHKTVADNYLYEVEKTSFSAMGDQLMYRGFKPLQQFYGTGLDDNTAFIGDFGSRLFVLKATKN